MNKYISQNSVQTPRVTSTPNLTMDSSQSVTAVAMSTSHSIIPIPPNPATSSSTSLTPLAHSQRTSFPVPATAIIHSPTPQSLHHEFIRLGSMRLKLKNKMLAILPEIYQSGIWKKYAGTIEEYAGKFGDISKTTVVKRLRLEGNLEDKPFLKAAIASVGVHKVAMVAKITTPEMDKSMAENICNMSKSTVQSLSKELRAGQLRDGQNDNCAERVSEDQLSFGDCNLVNKLQDFAHPSATNPSSLCHAIPLTKKIELDGNTTFLFLKLKEKLGKNLSDKEVLKLIIEEREKQEFPQKQSRGESEIVFQKDQSEKTIADTSLKTGVQPTTTDSTTFTGDKSNGKSSSDKTQSVKSLTGETFSQPRHIPAAKKRQVLQPTKGKCSYPNCNSPYAVLHHTDRYSESKSHDSVIPLCKVHHEFAHNNLIQNEKLSVHQWALELVKKAGIEVSRADILYRKYRSSSLP